jgi:hypothetical protein
MDEESVTLRASYACFQIIVENRGYQNLISQSRSMLSGVRLAEGGVEEVSYATSRLMQRPGEAKVHRVFAFK